jgi:hypothetical protein
VPINLLCARTEKYPDFAFLTSTGRDTPLHGCYFFPAPVKKNVDMDADEIIEFAARYRKPGDPKVEVE